MGHCRWFTRGLLIGPIVGFLAGFFGAYLLATMMPWLQIDFTSEIGLLPKMFGCGCVGIPAGALLGAAIGSLADFVRERNRFTTTALILLAGLCVVVFSLIVAVALLRGS